MKYLLKGGLVFSDGNNMVKDLYIADGKIVEGFNEGEADKVIDVSNKAIFPGFVDLHTHLREPGFSKKETVKTGTLAAAKGGFTTVLAMPNTNPVLDSPWEMEAFLKYLEDHAVIRVLPVAPLTRGRLGKEIADLGSLASIGIRFASDDGDDIQSTSLMRNVLA
ncbi:MAG TPA: amidohydrolase family protein [Firmicutes bacterium]|nr:amidohydrolase family protein [Bacillota bacterium]